MACPQLCEHASSLFILHPFKHGLVGAEYSGNILNEYAGVRAIKKLEPFGPTSPARTCGGILRQWWAIVSADPSPLPVGPRELKHPANNLRLAPAIPRSGIIGRYSTAIMGKCLESKIGERYQRLMKAILVAGAILGTTFGTVGDVTHRSHGRPSEWKDGFVRKWARETTFQPASHGSIIASLKPTNNAAPFAHVKISSIHWQCLYTSLT